MPEFLDILKENEGFVIRGSKKPANWDQKLKATIDLIENRGGLASHQRTFLLREALTTSDFPYLFADAIDRQVLALYKATEPVWKQYTRAGTVPRIWPQIGAKRFAITGGDQILDLVAEKGEYLASDRTETKYDLYVKKYGRQFDISWEAMINDDIGALQDTAVRFQMAASRTEHRLVVAAYAGDVGTHAAGNLYEAAVNEGVLALTIANLETSLENMTSFTDVNGMPILNRAKYLVVGPSLEMTARQILTSATKMWMENITLAAAGPATLYPMPTNNVVSQMGLQLIVDPWIPIVDTDGTNSWYLFADPNDIAAIEADHLSGHETPEICMKASDKVAIGGGLISPMDGDFATDDVLYRVRDVFGANKLDWRATYANIVA